MLITPALTAPAANPTASGLARRATNGFVTTLSAAINSSVTTIPLTSVVGLSADTAVTIVIEPNTANSEVVIGFPSTASLVNCVRHVEGATVTHPSGAEVRMFSTAMDHNSIVDFLFVGHNPDGTIKTSSTLTTPILTSPAISGGTQSSPTVTTPKIVTSLNDANGNEVIRTPATASAVNDLTVTNAATGGAVILAASGDDTNVTAVAKGKGTGFFLPQIPFYITPISVTGSTETVGATITVPAMPVACRVILMGFTGAALGSGAPTLTWQNTIRLGSTTAGLTMASTDNTKSSAAGIAESRTTSLCASYVLPANTSQSFVWTVISSSTTSTGGTFMALVVAA